MDFAIRAFAHSDDHAVEVYFDAERWFEHAYDDEIQELAEQGWGGNLAADKVAEESEPWHNMLKKLFAYLDIIKDLPAKKDDHGFECYVHALDAQQWLEDHRPELLERINALVHRDPASGQAYFDN